MNKKRIANIGEAQEVNSLALYLREISKISLLTADEEFALAKDIADKSVRKRDVAAIFSLDKGSKHGRRQDLHKRIRSLKLFDAPDARFLVPTQSLEMTVSRINRLVEKQVITSEQAQLLAGLIKNVSQGGLSAKSALVSANLRLVVSIAKGYIQTGRDLMDIISDGNIGLMKAADRFDHEKRIRFATYASFWIRQTIVREFQDSGRTIRIPYRKSEDLYNFKKQELELEETLERPPTELELSLKTEKTVSEIRALMAIAAGVGAVGSLDNVVGVDGTTTFLDFVESEGYAAPGSALFSGEYSEIIADLLRPLSEREQLVLRLRNGIGVHKRKTLEEIGDQLGLTREAIRQTQERALTKLRKSKLLWAEKGLLFSYEESYTPISQTD